MERIIPYIMENKTCLKPPTRQPLKKQAPPGSTCRMEMQHGKFISSKFEKTIAHAFGGSSLIFHFQVDLEMEAP